MTPERSRLVARAEPFTAEQAARLESIEARVPVDIAADVAEALLEVVTETIGLHALVAYAEQQNDYCCRVGCGDGACESCPCCGAGWCVSGADGLPEGAEDRERWLEIAAEHNPLAAALAAMPPADEALRERVEAVAAWCEGQAASRSHFAKVDSAYRNTMIPYEATAERLRDVLDDSR